MNTVTTFKKMDCREIKILERENETLALLREQPTPFDDKALECPNPMLSEYSAKEMHSLLLLEGGGGLL